MGYCKDSLAQQMAAGAYTDLDIAPAFRIAFDLDCYAAKPKTTKQVKNSSTGFTP